MQADLVWVRTDVRRIARATALAVTATLLLGLAGCAKKPPSRFDLVAGVDVCSLVSPAEAEQILGPELQPPHAEPTGSGIAGSCTWTFRQLTNEQQATLFVMMVTRASSPQGPPPSHFFTISQQEISASLGANPWPLEDLGDRAVLFQTRRPEHSELYLLQSETLLTLRMLGGSAAQLEAFARALSREIAILPVPAE
jgi:hypothetical protein